MELGLCRLRLETKACLFEQRCLGDPACAALSDCSRSSYLTIHHCGSTVKGWLTARKENIPKTRSVGALECADQQLFKAGLQ